MYSQNLFYPRYSNFRYNNYMPNFNSTYYPYVSYDEICNNSNKDISQEPSEESENNESTNENINSNDSIKADKINEENSTNQTRFGPFEFGNDRISLFGFSFALDDLILIGLIILLFLESDANNFALIIILGLMLFNINLSSLDLFL